MLIVIIIIIVLAIVLVFTHGVEVELYIRDGMYQFALYYIVLGRYRVIEIKKIKIKKKEKSTKKDIDPDILRYIRGSLDVDYSINVLELDHHRAMAIGEICSLLEAIDARYQLQVTQTIEYVYAGFSLDIRAYTSITNIIISYIKYKIERKQYAK